MTDQSVQSSPPAVRAPTLLPLLLLLLFVAGCSDTHPPGDEPVALGQIDELQLLSASVYSGPPIDYKLIFDADDMAAALILLDPEAGIPPHTHGTDKAYYFNAGQLEVWVDNELVTAKEGDSLFVPMNSATEIRNTGTDDGELFIFLPDGPMNGLVFQEPDQQTSDLAGASNVLVDPSSVDREYWNGVLSPETDAPVWWQNLIDTDSMVLGVTNIDAYYEVTSHYHEQTELVIFASGDGVSRVNDQGYAPIGEFSFIHPPSWSIHHSINVGSAPLREIYFFPAGPFETFEYIYR